MAQKVGATLAMDKKLRSKWLKALRSGKFKQAKKTLYDKETGGYCCLGVLCSINGSKETLNSDNKGLGMYGGSCGINEDQRCHLANMNDNGKNFKQIADYIEDHIKVK